MVENVYAEHEKILKKLEDLYKKYGFKGLLELSIKLKLDAESLLRIMAGVQGFDPELRRRIELLWEIEFGKVQVTVPKPELIPEEEFEPIEIEPEGIKRCSVFAHENDDFLTQKVTGSVSHEMNQKDILTEYVDELKYDGALKEVREEIDEIYAEFINARNDIFDISIAGDRLNISTLEGDECPLHRIYEFESVRLVSGESENQEAYGLRYSKGVAKDIGSDTLPQWVINKMVNVLKSAGFWED